VIPLLRRRGLFRTAYAGKTLREHYGLAWPDSSFNEGRLKIEQQPH
jgi:N-acetyl-S-(2-succino)cysteine monooxygenase